MCSEKYITTCTKIYKELQFLLFLTNAAAPSCVVLQLIFQP